MLTADRGDARRKVRPTFHMLASGGSRSACSLVCLLCVAFLMWSVGPLSGGGADEEDDLPESFDISWPTDPKTVGPRLDDNFVEPAYSATPTPELSWREKRLLEGAGSETELSKYLAAPGDIEAAVRMAFVSWDHGEFAACYHIATILLRRRRMTMEYVGLPEGMEDDPRKPGDETAFLRCAKEKTLVWRRDFARPARDWVAFELSQVNALHMRNCKRAEPHPGWTEVRFNNMSGVKAVTGSRNSGGPYSVRFFFAVRDAQGAAKQNAFEVSHGEKIADVRYERLMYVFRWCEPVRQRLLRLQASGGWSWAWWNRLPVFGTEGEGVLPGVDGYSREEPGQPAAPAAHRDSSPPWVLVPGLVLGVCLGFLLHAWLAARAGKRDAVNDIASAPPPAELGDQGKTGGPPS
ncbi:MAG TPA: hypothetical protein VNE39_04415 [Planctomycetota bacterium]|nr:hypothetical protein [Planctomycetota bacterium]